MANYLGDIVWKSAWQKQVFDNVLREKSLRPQMQKLIPNNTSPLHGKTLLCYHLVLANSLSIFSYNKMQE